MLSKIASVFVKAILDWFYAKFSFLLRQKKASDETKKKAEDDAEAVRQRTEKADTPKEREDAAAEVIGKF